MLLPILEKETQEQKAGREKVFFMRLVQRQTRELDLL